MIDQLLKESVTQLKNSGVDNPVREVRLMLAAILNTTHEQILFNPPQILTSEQMNQLEDWVCRRCKREPLAKIIGKKEFWGRDFFVTKDTLDPRPDTETVIDVILNLASNNKPLRVLDLGTGSGCLILTLLAERPNWTGVGVDFSQAALAVAQENAENLNLSKRVMFVQSDWFQNVEGVFDVIISNPPYIARDEVLSNETLHDPENALFADDGGLADYRRMLESASRFLTPSGFIVFEIGYRQATAVIEIAQFFEFDLVSLHQDLAGHDRCLVFKNKR
ncbi:MAG: peptide chain release factor N(5)-glutamine methyltransferase [Candidatus Paracaedibacteraceae bacterium]|nr:peptide chain release factor N(5)-glutamine methyltransferase [Candidatus Paracaedibacteraceae bacterium]